jgi:diadenosine tetraphosphate (Ap4A) HIT family hydrolase
MSAQLSHHEITQQTGCLFCERESHEILFSTDNFVVGFDNFPLTEGHLLIFSKAHYGCGGDISKDILLELVAIKEKVAALLEKAYATVSFYEHGRAGHCVSFGPDERLCHHFHLHALPLPIDISMKIDERFQRINIPFYGVIDTFFNKYGEYLFFENNKGLAGFYPVVDQIPPHFLRTLIANGLSRPERADWESFEDIDFIVKAIKEAQTRICL